MIEFHIRSAETKIDVKNRIPIKTAYAGGPRIRLVFQELIDLASEPISYFQA